MLSSFRVAVAQINTTVGDIEGNGRKILQFVHKADSLKSDLILFPELTVTGYPPEDLILKKSFISANINELKKIAREVGNIHALIGYIEKGAPPFNAAALLSSGKVVEKYNKVHLPNYSVFDEQRYFQPGGESPVFSVNNVRIGVSICEDLWHCDGPHLAQVEKGRADVILNLSSSPFHMGKYRMRRRLISRRAKENGVFIVYCNLFGGQDELVFDGGSLVASPAGKIIAAGKQFEEDLLIVDLPIHRAPISTTRTTFTRPETKKRGPVIMSEAQEVYSALVLGVRDYARKNGFSRAVLGLSGGIDSALTAVIAVDALGKENVTGITMPSVYSSSGSVCDSNALSKNLGINLKTISIKKIVRAFEESLLPAFEGGVKGVTEENIQSRVRGNILMAFSNQYGHLLLATGNKSEISTGYCTLYGDMAGGFAVIKDVPKTLVYTLSEHRNSVAGYDLIPKEIIRKEPSAELRPDQKDTDSLPPYPILDRILSDYVEKDRSLGQIVSKGVSAELAKKIISLVDLSEYKRRQAAPGVKITERAFGKDRRFPLVNQFKD